MCIILDLSEKNLKKVVFELANIHLCNFCDREHTGTPKTINSKHDAQNIPIFPPLSTINYLISFINFIRNMINIACIIRSTATYIEYEECLQIECKINGASDRKSNQISNPPKPFFFKITFSIRPFYIQVHVYCIIG